jgi:hypothetical protein
MIALARRHGRPVAALRFRVAEAVLLRRNAGRSAPAHVPPPDVRSYAALAARHTDRARLAAEGIDVVVDVPGEAEGCTARQAAAAIRLARRGDPA